MFDFIFSLIGLTLLFPVFIFIFIIGLFDTGSPVFRQERVGKDKKPFFLYKFRSMKRGTKSVGSHLASTDDITNWGAFLRRSKLDELPQLLNVLIGNMSLVGPRPCLYNQIEVIKEREIRGVFSILPGITGLAQINKIDMSDPVILAKYDEAMVNSLNLKRYFLFIFSTLSGKGFGDRVLKK